MELIRTLILHDGGLPGLAAMTTMDRPEACVIWHMPHRNRAIATRQQECIQAQMEVLGFSTYVVAAPLNHALAPATANPPDFSHQSKLTLESCTILLAAVAARSHGCHRVLWPANAAENTDVLTNHCKRAVLLQHLVNLHPEGEESAPSQVLEIDIPLLDCSDHQVADLAVRSGVPLNQMHWCTGRADAPCEQCESCNRWCSALSDLGITVSG